MKCPQICGLKVISFPVEPKGPVTPQQLASLKQAHPVSPSPAFAGADNCFVSGEAWGGSGTPLQVDKRGLTPLPLGSKFQIRENLNRLDTCLCFALAREDLDLKAQLLKQRLGIQTQCADMEAGIPDKLLPTLALQSKKHSVELEIAQVKLQHGKPTTPQLELRKSLECELLRRIPGKRAEQASQTARLRAFSNNEFLTAYQSCAQRLYSQADTPGTSYESLVALWGQWQTHLQEAKTRFGAAWLWQYI